MKQNFSTLLEVNHLYKGYQRIFISILIGIFILCALALYFGFSFLQTQNALSQKRVYERNSLTGEVYALEENRLSNPNARKLEFAAQSRNFLHLVFEVGKENFKRNQDFALRIASENTREYLMSNVYEDKLKLKERVSTRGVRSFIDIKRDSLYIFEQGYIQESDFVVLFVDGSTTKSLIFKSKMYLKNDIARTPTNPYAILVDNFKIIDIKNFQEGSGS